MSSARVGWRFAASAIVSVLSLGLIGNGSATELDLASELVRGVFDEETRRKPLASAADAVIYHRGDLCTLNRPRWVEDVLCVRFRCGGTVDVDGGGHRNPGC